MSRFIYFIGLGLALITSGWAASPLAGAWKIVPERSTDFTPWKDYDLTIEVDGDAVTLRRHLAWGRRAYDDTTALDVSRDVNEVTTDFWPDNRHLGAYLGGDKTKRIHASWLDEGRLLRLSTDLVLDTQQGSRAVNILSDYRVSANGEQLTLIELRSTRNRPIVYTFTRVAR